MNEAGEVICHDGVIDHFEGSRVFVRILSHSACDSCHSNRMCSISEMKEKLIEVELKAGQKYAAGEKVRLVMRRSLGNKAVFLGYLLPFIIMITALVIAGLFFTEGVTGLITIASVGIYYLLLALFRNRIGKSFKFGIQPATSYEPV